MSDNTLQQFNCYINARLGKLACPRVNDDQKMDVDDQKLNSGRPHDYSVLDFGERVL